MEDFRRILHLIKPYWHRVALAGIISIIVSGLNASLAWLVKPMMDEILIKKTMTMLWLPPVVIFLIFLFRGIFLFLHEYLMKSAAQKMIMNLRNTLYAHILDLPIGYFGKTSSGDLISKTINDTSILQGVIAMTVKDLFIESTTVIALSAVAFWRRWDLTLIALLILPSAFYVVGRLGKKIKLVSRRTQEKISSLTSFLNESFAGIKIIKAFSRQADDLERFKHINKDFYRENMRATRISEFAGLIMEVVGGIGIGFVIWYGGRLIVQNVITVGDFTSFLTAIFLVYTPAKRLAKVNVGIQQTRGPLERIYSLLSETKETEGLEELVPISKEIDFRGVSFVYPSASHEALKNINLHVKKGDVIAIVGKSGGGKTSLVNLLPRFYVPTAGAIYIDGVDISSATFHSLRTQFGIVSQEVILFDDSIFANIAYGKSGAEMADVIAASKAAYAHDFITELPQGYDTMIGEKGVRLSGGQRQRLSIARAILKNPPILILDEATSSLDTASEMMVQKALENLMTNRTTFVIAHRLSTVMRADRIIVLDKGMIVESGNHKELFEKNGIYRNLYELQFSR